MFKIPMEVVKARHTEEIVEKATQGMENFESFIEELSEREKAIFEIAYANGYSDAKFDELFGEMVEVLK